MSADSAGPGRASKLPAWITEFHELGLRELCRRCVTRLPARLGYAEVSLYLHDEQAGVLTLAESTHSRRIEVAVRMADEQDHLMVSVARAGRLLKTSDARGEWSARGLRRPAAGRYADGACLIAPLVSGGRLWGVLNFSRADCTDALEAELSLPALFSFIGRSLRFARAYDQARIEARVDMLTGLYNQRWIVEALTKEIRRSQRFDIPLALIVADVDGLKPVNDRVGHLAGDCLLRYVATRITSALRQFDSAARVGGDEFVVLLPATGLEGARRVARRVLEAIRGDAAIYRGVPLPVRASLGVVQWQAGWDPVQLIEAADKAMYLAKQRGRDQLVCQPPDAPAAAHVSDELSQRLWSHPTSISAEAAVPRPAPVRPPAPADEIAGV